VAPVGKKKEEEEEAKQAVGSSDIGNGNAAPSVSSCNHMKLPENHTLEDFKEALALFDDFETRLYDYSERVKRAYAMIGESCYKMMMGEAIWM
jgi:hypothetical protein